MLKRIVNLDSTEFTIDREIARSLMDAVRDDIIRDSNAKIYYISDSEENDFSASENIYTNKTLKSRIEVATEKVTKSDYKNTNMLLRNSKNPIMVDPDICFHARQNTVMTTYSYTVRYFNKSRSGVLRVVSLLKSLFGQDAAYIYADLNYYYYLPKPFLALLKDIYYKKTGSMDYYSYIESIATVPIDYVSMRDGKFKAPVIRELQPSVYATIDGDLYDIKPEKDDQGYYIEFNITLEVEVPSSLFVEYPILVNNQSLDKIFLPQDRYLEYTEMGGWMDYVQMRLVSWWSFRDLRKTDAVIRIPTYDEYEFPIELTYGSFRLLSFLLTVDPDDPTLVLSLDDLESMSINTDIIEYMKQQTGKRLFTFGDDIFFFELFENCYKPDKGLYVDDEGNIRTDPDNPLDPTKYYHLSLGVIWDLDLLSLIDTDNELIQQYIEFLSNLKITHANIPEYATEFKVEIMRIVTYLLGGGQ